MMGFTMDTDGEKTTLCGFSVKDEEDGIVSDSFVGFEEGIFMPF